MKRTFLLMILAASLLCGCSRASDKPTEPPQIDVTQDQTVCIHSPLTEISASWHFAEDSSFILKEPSPLSGVQITCSEQGGTVSAADTAVKLPQDTAFVLLDRAMRTLNSGSIIPVRTQDGWKYDGSLYGFTAMQNAQDGRLLSMHFPKHGISVTFEL